MARQVILLGVFLPALKIASAVQPSHPNPALRVQASLSNATSPKTDVEKEAKHFEKEAKKVKNGVTKSISHFKVPDYGRVDSLSRATGGFLDWFLVIYWGTCILIVVVIELVLRQRASAMEDIEDDFVAHRSSSFLCPDGDGQSKVLKPNLWALNLVASCGHAKDRNGEVLSPKLVFIAGLIMGCLQLLTLFLVVYDIDPAAHPYTEMPAASWKTSPLTVNCMKVVMVFFLGMYVVSEAADSYDNYVLGCAVRCEDLAVHRFFVLFIPMFHYLITLSVIFAGASVVLSCQDVPRILFSSMAILFITGVDELFWGFVHRTFEIDAKWQVHINESKVVEVQSIKKCIIMFPMLWGFCLLGRAWYRDLMPSLAVRAFFKG